MFHAFDWSLVDMSCVDSWGERIRGLRLWFVLFASFVVSLSIPLTVESSLVCLFVVDSLKGSDIGGFHSYLQATSDERRVQDTSDE